MSNISSWVKCELLSNLLQFFDAQNATTGDNALVSRAYASLLFSVSNLGLNVATRAPLQNSPHTDTLFMETGLSNSGTYSRSEDAHPGYGVVQDILTAAKKLLIARISKADKEEVDVKYKAVREAIETNDLTKIKAAINTYQLYTGGKGNDVAAYGRLFSELYTQCIPAVSKWVGFYITPAELLERIFAEFDRPTVILLCRSVAAQLYASELENCLKSFNYNLPKVPVSMSIGVSSKIEPMNKSKLFSQMMTCRLDLLQKVKRQLDKEPLDNSLLVVSVPKSSYPCLMFDMRKFYDKAHTAFVDAGNYDVNGYSSIKFKKTKFKGIEDERALFSSIKDQSGAGYNQWHDGMMA